MKVLDTDFARSFIRMCNDGWEFGWHESNGGNASYRLRSEEAGEVRTGFRARPWVRIDADIPTLAGEFFLITAAGSHFRNIVHDPKRTLGIIEIDRTGTCWRECWGFKGGGRPTSELVAHLINHEVRKAATQGASRVLYHCHPTNLAAMTCVVPHDSAVFTRTLWAQLAECALVCRRGVEIIGWEVPGSIDLAIESAKVMEHTDVVIWPHHGLFVAGDTIDEAFGIAHTIEKAAEIFCKARACGLPNVSKISDSDLVSFSREYDLELARRNVYAKPYLDAPKSKPVAAHEATSAKKKEPTFVPGTFHFLPTQAIPTGEASVSPVLQEARLESRLQGQGIAPMGFAGEVPASSLQQAGSAHEGRQELRPSQPMQPVQPVQPTQPVQLVQQEPRTAQPVHPTEPVYHFYPKSPKRTRAI